MDMQLCSCLLFPLAKLLSPLGWLLSLLAKLHETGDSVSESHYVVLSMLPIDANNIII